jgi:hypothetical protein
MAASPRAYRLDGTSLEACSCASPCPCLSGKDPDGGRCDAVMAYHVDRGQVSGVDVSGLSVVNVVQIPGNAQQGHWRQVLFVDDRATTSQRDALVAAFTGKLGGSLGELAALVADRVAIQAAAIDYAAEQGIGTIRVATRSAAAVGSAGQGGSVAAGSSRKLDVRIEIGDGAASPSSVTLNTRCAVVPSSPARRGRSFQDEVILPAHAMSWTCSGRNGISGTFHAES